MMLKTIKRQIERRILDDLARQPTVALEGPRKIGKTTVAQKIAKDHDALCFDLSRVSDLRALEEPEIVLRPPHNRLIVIDEVQNKPDLFNELRPLIDRRRYQCLKSGRKSPTGMFLVLGYCDKPNLGQVRETLVGRIAHVEMLGFDCLDIPKSQIHQLWDRGGYPESYAAANSETSLAKRREYLLDPFRGKRPVVRSQMQILLNLIAASHGRVPNKSDWSEHIGCSEKTVTNHLYRLENLFLIRRLPAYDTDFIQRIVKRPKYYIRDSGLMHFLVDASLPNPSELRATSAATYGWLKASWEGFVIENLCSCVSMHVQPYFYRAHNKEEIDLVFEFYGGEIWAIAIRLRARIPLTKNNQRALDTLKPSKTFIVHSEHTRKKLPNGVEAVPLRAMMLKLQKKEKTLFSDR